jgi:hypothetical protein
VWFWGKNSSWESSHREECRLFQSPARKGENEEREKEKSWPYSLKTQHRGIKK